MAERFGDAAAQLWGIAAQLLGWRPSEFWNSTPSELAAALTPPEVGRGGADSTLLEILRQQFPDD